MRSFEVLFYTKRDGGPGVRVTLADGRVLHGDSDGQFHDESVAQAVVNSLAAACPTLEEANALVEWVLEDGVTYPGAGDAN